MTNNKQQTAVEWLAEKTFNQIELLKHLCINEEQFLNNMLFFREQAKEMDKEQKIRDFTDGYLYHGEQLRPWLIDKWYNETYGNDKQ